MVRPWWAVRCGAHRRTARGAQLRLEHRTLEVSDSKKMEISTIASNHHIELNPSDAGIYDRVVVQVRRLRLRALLTAAHSRRQAFIKEGAQAQSLEAAGGRSFKGARVRVSA